MNQVALQIDSAIAAGIDPSALGLSGSNTALASGPSNGWDWDEKAHWPAPQQRTVHDQSFGNCFNGAMKLNALPGSQLTPQQQGAAQSCNQQLCNSLNQTFPTIPPWHPFERQAAQQILLFFTIPVVIPKAAACHS